MKATSSKIVIFAALIGNFLIAIAKFIAAAVSQSAAMFSEGIHSLVDVGNQALLLLGIRLSQRPPDKLHPFGYGKEIYFWSLIVAILLFSVGGGMSLYKGITHWHTDVLITDVKLTYIVLVLAIIIEFFAWLIAYKALRERHQNVNFFRSIERAKDPALIVVLLEDTAALIGLVIAVIGITASIYFQDVRYDAAASMLIGLLLIIVAFWLAHESKQLLLGEAADPAFVSAIRTLIQTHPNIREERQVLTMHLGPEDILVNFEVDFIDGIASEVVEATIAEVEEQIKVMNPAVKRVFISAKSFRPNP